MVNMQSRSSENSISYSSSEAAEATVAVSSTKKRANKNLSILFPFLDVFLFRYVTGMVMDRSIVGRNVPKFTRKRLFTIVDRRGGSKALFGGSSDRNDNFGCSPRENCTFGSLARADIPQVAFWLREDYQEPTAEQAFFAPTGACGRARRWNRADRPAKPPRCVRTAALFRIVAGRPVLPLSFSLGVDRRRAHSGGARNRRMAARMARTIGPVTATSASWKVMARAFAGTRTSDMSATAGNVIISVETDGRR